MTLQKQKQEKMHQNPHKTIHQPVLLDEVLKYLDPKKGERYLDLTAGYGGHAQLILERTQNYVESYLIDRDDFAIKELEKKFDSTGVNLIKQDYLGASKSLKQANQKFDLILADLGVSSPHLNEVNRGFSFNSNGPLDMRMDQGQKMSAWNIVNETSFEELADLLWKYGEEPKSRQIARLITLNRPVSTTEELAALAKKAWPGHSKTHPATRTFQAVRIAVNNELDQLSEALPVWLDLLAPTGRLAVISFHSLEDRIVKQYFLSESGDNYDSRLTLLTRHPVTPKPQEQAHNPRSRSAKLRVVAAK